VIAHETQELLAERIIAAPGPDAVDGARCAQADPDHWFPDKGEHGSAQHARRVCVKCPVRAWCLMVGMEGQEQWGVWGGKSQRQRLAIARTHPALAPQDDQDGPVAA
jgi:hypothetical protein